MLSLDPRQNGTSEGFFVKEETVQPSEESVVDHKQALVGAMPLGKVFKMLLRCCTRYWDFRILSPLAIFYLMS